MILPPERCETMADLRGQIDRIDRALLDLLSAQAQRYRQKWRTCVTYTMKQMR
jgi:hypothetical protein